MNKDCPICGREILDETAAVCPACKDEDAERTWEEIWLNEPDDEDSDE